MSPDTKQVVFVATIVLGGLHLFSLGTLLITGNPTPLVGILLGDVAIGSVIGLFALAERLFPGDPS